MAAPERAHLQVSYDSGEWSVSLNGRSLENMLAPGGVQIFANEDDLEGPKAVLTFADVELDVDLEGAEVVAHVPESDRPEGGLQSEIHPDGEFWSYRVLNPDGTVKVSGRASTKGQAQGYVYAAGGLT